MTSLIFFAASLLFAGLITVIEHVRNPGPTDWVRNLQAWAVELSIGLAVMGFWPDWRGGSLIDVATLPLWLALPIFLLVRDFLEFLYHFASHRIPALWAMHSLHHSDPEMTVLTTNRHFWGDQLVKAVTIWSAMTMLTTSTDTLMIVYAGVSLYNYFVHANLRIDFGRWSWVLNSPAYHRHHHSKLPADYDTNFAALFPIWDVLCGTYRRPHGWPPCGLPEGGPQSLGDLITWPLRWLPGRTARQPEQLAGEA